MIVEMLLLVLIGASVFAFVIAPVVMSGREAATRETGQDEPADEVAPTATEQHDTRSEPERQPEQKQPVRDAP